MTAADRQHTNRVLRVLKTAVRDLEKLAETAVRKQTYPITTQKALIETIDVLNKARTRVIAQDASVI